MANRSGEIRAQIREQIKLFAPGSESLLREPATSQPPGTAGREQQDAGKPVLPSEATRQEKAGGSGGGKAKTEGFDIFDTATWPAPDPKTGKRPVTKEVADAYIKVYGKDGIFKAEEEGWDIDAGGESRRK